MNDPLLALQKLEEIREYAARSDLSLTEKAASFSAAELLSERLANHFGKHELKGSGYLCELVERIRWSISAMLGFDITNGHDVEQHSSWALGSINQLRHNLEKLA